MTAFSFELLPRISRAQSMDALSSQATVSGYVATLTCAINLPLFFPMFMTAAGTVPPAKVFVMGAGVAGLQAIATARRLGANVRAYDVRPAAAEEVKSLGATFVTLDLESQEGAGGYAKEQSAEFIQKQQELMAEQVAQCNVIITTAAIPGRPAPKLLTQKMVEGMAKGSVVFDLAAESGGNCELSKPGEIIEHDGVKIIGARNVPSQLPTHASFLYSRNVAELVLLMTKDGNFEPNFEDEIVNGSCVLKNGEIFNEMTKKLIEDSK
jgi:NAD(P) transhydrogenase subunit alpha